MSLALFGAVESGLIYAIMALGVYLSFRILDFPDLTVDGSFVTGAAVSAIMIVNGVSPFIATITALLVGFLAGSLTGILHTKGKVNPLLAGILMMIALYSINLRIMGKSNLPLLNESTLVKIISDFWKGLGLDDLITNLLSVIGVTGFVPKTWSVIIFAAIISISIKLVIDYFLKTEIGLSLRATGDNKNMIRSFSANTDRLTILGLGLSNALVAFSGSLISQYNGFSDIGMGIGIIIIGLASVIIGEAIFGTKTIARATLAVIGGAIIYRIVVALALRIDFLEAGDVKLITASIVVFALVFPKLLAGVREKKRRKERLSKRILDHSVTKRRGDAIATIKGDL
ncbi:ABC transporter permease [Bacillus luteolus]|uniref:ABC transporter permease n=1 Tax=Litchfieldia luteola TaxID=682179 RepID=A0ABR9QDZ7_9BACI|nr:ABC transporter permease [Cytobacillus luteolus]MBE4906713.1 ABC transporter permease [Cytobacillus luteolus]MBP1940638.1 putative ABC transport system permease protein [Cytobacillus luteolus]